MWTVDGDHNSAYHYLLNLKQSWNCEKQINKLFLMDASMITIVIGRAYKVLRPWTKCGVDIRMRVLKTTNMFKSYIIHITTQREITQTYIYNHAPTDVNIYTKNYSKVMWYSNKGLCNMKDEIALFKIIHAWHIFSQIVRVLARKRH